MGRWRAAPSTAHEEDFRRRAVQAYGLKTTRIPTNLTRMRDFHDGDLLVTPHLRGHNTVVIHVVKGDYPDCYVYREGDPSHLNHGIRIRASYGLDGAISANTDLLTPWKAKLPWMRLPVLAKPEFEALFEDVIEKVHSNQHEVLGASELQAYLDRLQAQVVAELQRDLSTIAPMGDGISFESVCERLLETEGYRIPRHHVYDGKGGDVDFVCVRDRTDASAFEAGETILFVQVKKHDGVTDSRAVEQVLQMLEQDPTADGCVITLADEFSDEATELAEANGINLIDGPEVCQLLLRQLATV